MQCRQAEPAAGNGRDSGQYRKTGDAASITRPKRPFGCYLDDELARAEAVYTWFTQQPDLDFPEETRALFRLWLDDITEEWRFRARHSISAPGPAYPWPDGLIEELKAAVDLRQVADDDVRLTHRGRAAMALCPFHDDKSPSLAVYSDGWTCFGCDAHGDLFDWIMLFRQIREFPEAVRYAAGLAGRPLPEREERRKQRRRKLTTRVESGKVFVE